jgi:hypothetical protein
MIENGECVEIHTSNVEEPIIYHNMDESDESDNINRFYMISGDDDEEPTYYEIISKDRKKKEKLDAPSAKNRPNLNIHSNDEIKLNWKITDSVMNGKFGSAVIDCCVEKIDNFEKWKMKSEKLIEFLNKNGKSPSHKFKNPDENKLASWNSRQKRIYNPKGPEFSKERMKNPEIWQIWTDIITNEKYSNFLVVIDNIQDWKNKSQEMLEFYDDKGKKPSKCSKNQDEKNLSSWIKNQKQNYNPKGPESSKERMKNPEIWQIWTDIILNEKYSKFLAKSIPTEKWKNDKIKMIEFFDKNGRIPSRHSKNQDEKNLSSWIKNQNAHYNPNGSESSKFIMNNPKIWQIWTDIIVNEKYSKFFVKTIRTDKWKNNKIKMIEFFDKNRKRPSKNSKNQDEKNLTSWIKNQNAQYNPNGPEFSKFIMNNPEIWLIWNATINDHRYKKFFDVSQSSPLPRKRKISTEVQKSQSQSKFPKKDSIMSEEDKSEGSQSESEDIFQSSSLPQKRRFE